MAVAVEIVGDKAVLAHLNRIAIQLPKNMVYASEEFGQSLQRRMKREITLKKLVWTSKLHERTRWVQDGNVGKLLMPVHGIYVDRMRPHWVKLKRGRLIRQWAIEKGMFQTAGKPFKGAEMFAAGIEERSIFVRPHPFIQGPVDRTIADLPIILKRALDKAVSK